MIPMSPTPSSLRVTTFGTAALVAARDAVHARAVAEHLRVRLARNVGAIVPGAESVVVHPAPAGTASQDVVALVERALTMQVSDLSREPKTEHIAVRYDGEDLSVVADLLGVSTQEVIARHTGAVYTVDFLGFAPGFPYLSGLDPFLASVPRLDSPRSRVPAGSVGLAAGRTCIYPTPSPGGWHLLGSTSAVLFDATSERSPALLSAGMQVVFEAVR